MNTSYKQHKRIQQRSPIVYEDRVFQFHAQLRSGPTRNKRIHTDAYMYEPLDFRAAAHQQQHSSPDLGSTILFLNPAEGFSRYQYAEVKFYFQPNLLGDAEGNPFSIAP